MGKKHIPITAKENKLITKLRKHPALFERFAAIMEISDGEDGAIKTADEVEALLIEEVRKLGKTSLEHWAKETETRVGAAHLAKNPGSYCGKKNS